MFKNSFLVIAAMLWTSMSMAGQTEYKVLSEDIYDAGALYGYMNGGSELYLEYGFQSLTVQELEIGGEVLTFQAFTMPDEELAYGIFSINVFKCGDCSVIDRNKCCNPYQLQAIVANKYLSIINTTGSLKAQEAAQALYYHEASSLKGKSFGLPEIIRAMEPKNSFLVNGLLAIENRVAYWADVYQSLEPGLSYILNWGSSDLSAMVFKDDAKSMDWPSKQKGYHYQRKSKNGYAVLFRYTDDKTHEANKLLSQF